MTARETASRIARRSAENRVPVDEALVASLTAYLELLAQWNRTINLTGLQLEPPTDEAIDRLVLEPLGLVRHVRPDDRLAIDIGSGGGSPAIPLKLAVPTLRVVLVESRVRKSAFLREVIRQLGLQDVAIENQRAEQLVAQEGFRAAADLVTMRGVRADESFLRTAAGFLRPGGRLFWLVTPGNAVEAPQPFQKPRIEPLLATRGSQVAILGTPVSG
jgi:16S rRNA (guanine527-N7)-methyltransferase